MRLGKAVKAIKYHEKSLAIFKEIGSPNAIQTEKSLKKLNNQSE